MGGAIDEKVPQRLRRLVSGVPLLNAIYHQLRRIAPQRSQSFWDLPVEVAVRMAYNVALLREPDEGGERDFVRRLESGEITRNDMVQWLRESTEFSQRISALGVSIHLGRCDFVRSLPRAQRILDLGGTDLNNQNGAMVQMGYPYPFEELVVIDLPSQDRHAIYRSPDNTRKVATPLGPVTYRYASMTDLSEFADETFDLVYSGQSIEHVERSEGRVVLHEAYRVLRPGGHLGLDTPNARATRLQQTEFIDPDHKVEYTHDELSGMLLEAGYTVLESKGLNYVGKSLEAGTFEVEEAAANRGLHAEVRDCYILTYLCQKST
ncbi:MAG: methyltransferase domain-containing protein [Acidimicrobiales bacterium]